VRNVADKVGLAFVGLGWWGKVLADAVQRSGQGKIVSGYARTESTREAFAEHYGCLAADRLDDMLRDPEVEGIVAATPHSHHVELVLEAASGGKHIFVDKPLALTVTDADRAIRAAADAGIVLQVGHQRRLQAANRLVRQMIEAGELGNLHQLEANMSIFKQQPPTWRSDPTEQPLGGLTALGVHSIDTLHYFAGPMKRVFTISKQIVGNQGALDEATGVLVEFEQGPVGYIGFSFSVPKITTVGVYGDRAAAWSEEEGTRLYVQRNDEIRRHEQLVQPKDALAEQMAEFIAAIRGEITPEVGANEGRAVVEVVEALIESDRSGQPVDLASYRQSRV
jgi:predicted dehydrogenase